MAGRLSDAEIKSATAALPSSDVKGSAPKELVEQLKARAKEKSKEAAKARVRARASDGLIGSTANAVSSRVAKTDLKSLEAKEALGAPLTEKEATRLRASRQTTDRSN